MAVKTRTITKVLVANRGEIAVRIMRAARDAGMASVAVYAEPDSQAPFVEYADEAFAIGGTTAADSYLDINKILSVAQRSGADAVHPGYGFLAENADFAQAIIDAGLIWIGPSPQAIADLGDKVVARQIAEKVNAPMMPGTKDPLKHSSEAEAFADEYGLPIAIKAAFGGGGRGMKVAYERSEVAEIFESATREAVVAFGRGECFVERYLDRARHVEAQVLADQHGNVVVVGTRDCSLQRRFQKLVEEAPAPFLTNQQLERIYSSAKDICRAVGYHGAGTVEYLVGSDGLISFLEVNTRLQVEHPVTEETTGIDLVQEQFRIAQGLELSITEDPSPRGHSIEFRINGEDAGSNFLPTPGEIITYQEPSGPGIRVDSGVRAGSVVGGQFDSMLAKLIVTGGSREEALRRARRALSEYIVEGLPTVIPFHQAVIEDPAFIGNDSGFQIYTRWIEQEWVNTVEPYSDDAPETEGSAPRETHVVEINGRRVEVSLPAGFGVSGAAPKKKRKKARSGAGATSSGNAVTAPMQGTVIKIGVEEGQQVNAGDVIVVLEAMKMENPLKAHKSGTVTHLPIETGNQVNKGQVLLEIN